MLTINIEDSSVKITSVKGKQVVSAVEAPLEAGWVQGGLEMTRSGDPFMGNL